MDKNEIILSSEITIGSKITIIKKQKIELV